MPLVTGGESDGHATPLKLFAKSVLNSVTCLDQTIGMLLADVVDVLD